MLREELEFRHWACIEYFTVWMALLSTVAHLISFLIDHITHCTETWLYLGSMKDVQYRHSHFVGYFFDRWLYHLAISTPSLLSLVAAGKVLSVIIFLTWISYRLVSSSVRTDTKSGKSVKYSITESFLLRIMQGPRAEIVFKVELSNGSLSLA